MKIAWNHPWLCLALFAGIAGQPAATQAESGAAGPKTDAAAARDGQRDFDFELGAWDVQLSRLLEPLAGSDTWVEYQGTSVVRKVWDGRANLGELDVSGDAGRIQGLSLRLYNPETRLWNISWANSRDGVLTQPPMVGGFDEDGRGEFYNQETLNGRPIRVRFIFSGITKTSFELEQAFSDDGGETWEPNWIARFQRQTPAQRP